MDKKTLPIQKAVALRYEPLQGAPQVIAKGSGIIAANIIEKSKANQIQIPIYKDPVLVEELTKMDIGDSIPKELYEIVAQILVFVGDLDKKGIKYK